MKELVDVHFPDAICLAVVVDHFNTGDSLYKVFVPTAFSKNWAYNIRPTALSSHRSRHLPSFARPDDSGLFLWFRRAA
jgi:hypothetical protein